MNCGTCKRTDAYHVKTFFSRGMLVDTCNYCGDFSSGGGLEYSDVYFPRPHSLENITDKNGTPIHFESRAHKARVMREQGMSESGDRIRGSYEFPRPSGRTWYEQRRSQGKIR